MINPAGILRDGMFHKMSDADWDAVIEVHLRGSFNVARATIEHFREQNDGAYVLFTSTSGLIGNIGQTNYGAAKMGIVGLSRIIAMEGAPKNVRSNFIAPFAWTRMIATIPIKDEASRPARRADAARACAPTRWPSSPSPWPRRRQGHLRPDLRRARQRGGAVQPAAPGALGRADRGLDAARP